MEIISTDTLNKEIEDRSVKSRSLLIDQQWNYEWEKAYVKQNDTEKNQISQKNNSKNEQENRAGNSPTVGEIDGYSNNEGRQGILVSTESTNSRITDENNKRITGKVMAEQGLSKRVSVYSENHNNMAVKIENIKSQNIKQISADNNARNSTNFIDKNIYINEAQKQGLLIYKSTDQEIKIWLKDKNMSKKDGMSAIKGLKEILQKTGIKIAAATLNGELLFDNDIAENKYMSDEVIV